MDPILSRTAKFSLTTKLCSKITSQQFHLRNKPFRNRHSATLFPQHSFRSRVVGCAISNTQRCAPKISFRNGLPAIGLRDAGCGMPTSQSCSPQLPPCNSSPTIFIAIRSFWPSLQSLIFFLKWTSHISVDLLTYLQLPLRDSSGPSYLNLWTQPPPIILCKIC